MDVSRLPIIAHGPGLPAPPADAAQRNRGGDPVAEAAAAARRRPRDAAEQVIQGELLQRNRGEQRYNSTSDYLRGRRFEAGDEAGSGFAGTANPAGRQAVGAYLSHTRELIQPDLNRGTAVDYFI